MFGEKQAFWQLQLMLSSATVRQLERALHAAEAGLSNYKEVRTVANVNFASYGYNAINSVHVSTAFSAFMLWEVMIMQLRCTPHLAQTCPSEFAASGRRFPSRLRSSVTLGSSKPVRLGSTI